MAAQTSTKKHEDKIADNELASMETAAPMRAPAIFEAIRREGEAELNRPTSSLLLSGLTAGLALGTSVYCEALLRSNLPDAAWRPLVESFGYSVGFVIVILGQLQLFTENTISAVCPALDEPCPQVFKALGRLWALVLSSNVVGAGLLAAILTISRPLNQDVWAAVLSISEHAMSFGFGEMLVRGIGAGWLIAALVWIMPNAAGQKLWLIVLVTYIIALGDFAHIIAGTTEATVLVLTGAMSPGEAFAGFFIPAVIGNILGGTVLFTLLTWGQIRAELAEGAQPYWSGKAR